MLPLTVTNWLWIGRGRGMGYNSYADWNVAQELVHENRTDVRQTRCGRESWWEHWLPHSNIILLTTDPMTVFLLLVFFIFCYSFWWVHVCLQWYFIKQIKRNYKFPQKQSLKHCIKPHTDDPLGILNPGKPFIQCFSSLRNFLKTRIKHSSIVFNTFTIVLLLVITLSTSTVEGMSLQALLMHINDHYIMLLRMMWLCR